MTINIDLYTSLFADSKPLDVVIDTDTYNEVDDQFSVAYALLSPERLNVLACYAAPFINDRTSCPADGMRMSMAELEKIYNLLEIDSEQRIYNGATTLISDTNAPAESDAVQHLIRQAHERTDKPLCVICIAALTNLASALMIDPSIAQKIVVVWLGGHPYNWHTANEFNLAMDIKATKQVLESNAPLIHIPCKNVAEHLRMTIPELEVHLGTRSLISRYLFSIFKDYLGNKPGWARPIWDIAAIASLIDHRFVSMNQAQLPSLNSDLTWNTTTFVRPVLTAYSINRNLIYNDFFCKIQ
ncbi:nucleoside hydrolase [Poriferisphaera sp. WC338]|uniref:nucleoside hydrolase n=1 Tax=Poriferisphaera sp. WC338 TaxID=3425129 RepID=UPI003D813FD5